MGVFRNGSKSEAHHRGRVKRPAQLVLGVPLRTLGLGCRGGVEVTVTVRMMLKGYTPERVKSVKSCDTQLDLEH